LASALNNLANLYLKQNNYAQASDFFTQSNLIAENEKLHGVVQRNYEGLSSLYERSGKTQKALEYYKKYALSKDSVFTNELKQQIADLKVQYETEKSNRENQVLRKQLIQQQEIQELKTANALQERNQFVGIIILLILTSIIVSLYLHYRNSRKLKNQLQEHNKTLELRVAERTRELQEVNATKDRFFSIIAHDLKSPFNGLLGFSNLLYDEFDVLDMEQKKEYTTIIRDAATDIYRLLENLLEWASSQTGLIKIETQKIDIAALIHEIIQAGKPMQVGKKIETKVEIKSKKLALADVDTVKTVLRNLYSNALKFTPNHGTVIFVVEDYESRKEKPHIVIRMVDNGVGIKKEDVKNLFTLDKKVSTAGTNLETGTGLGLILCREFVEKNGGQLWLESESDPNAAKPGSIFSFTLPAVS
jgi:signal transduction histidine kinase